MFDAFFDPLVTLDVYFKTLMTRCAWRYDAIIDKISLLVRWIPRHLKSGNLASFYKLTLAKYTLIDCLPINFADDNQFDNQSHLCRVTKTKQTVLDPLDVKR